MKKLVSVLIFVTIIGFCLTGCSNGDKNKGSFYVTHILFSFSDSQKEFIDNNKTIDGVFENTEIFEEFARDISKMQDNPGYDPEYECALHKDNIPEAVCSYDGDGLCPSVTMLEKYIFGREAGGVFVDGIYEELQKALSGLTGQEAINVFEEYSYRYNDDTSIWDNDKGYLIPPGGVGAYYVQTFTDLSLKLYNKNDPASSVGNAFVNGSLAYCYSVYGVHIIMVKSVYL